MEKTAKLGVLCALSLIISFVETYIPLPIAVPGIKLGLSNIIMIFILYKLGFKEALIVNICRIVLSGLMFSGLYTIIYALSGGILAVIVMKISKSFFNVITVSILGAVFHIIGQLFIAGITIGFKAIFYYAPTLLVFSLLTGALIGILGEILIKRYVNLEKIQ